ncbi:MAG: hypothetical protein Ta2G_19400 [Termitinemataceae bacterium]|nr:MAG: hypothetical protein Ta2G_19400 [Termitinemataceae bacterium]
MKLIIFALVIIIGVLALALVIKLKKSNLFFFISLVMIFYGVFYCVLFSGVAAPDFTFNRMWPLLCTSAGLSLLASGVRYYKKPRFIYIITSLFFIALSILLLMFSSGIIDLPVKKFVLRTMPLFLVISAAVIMAVSVIRKKCR